MKSCEFQGSRMAEVDEEVEAGHWPSLGPGSSRPAATDTALPDCHPTGSARVEEALRLHSGI